MTPQPSLRLALLLGTALAAPTVLRAQDTTLDEISVQGSSYETEGSKSYTSNLVSVGEKSAVAQREVPQSTYVITRQQITDRDYSALETALNDTPGVLVLNNDEGRSSLYSRGFEFDYLYYDGLPAPVTSIYGTQPDLSIVDHVEVLKGPAGLFTAIGSPAGAMNMRLKQANRTDPGGYVTGSVDSNGHYRTEIDYGGALNKSGTLRGRAVVAYGDGDGYMNKQTNGVTSLYGTLAWDITPDTTATLSVSRMKRKISPTNGLPTYSDGALIWTDSDATTAADWNRFNNQTTDLVAGLEHHFDNGGTAKLSLRQSRQTANFLYAFAGAAANANNQVSTLSWLARDWEQNSTAIDVHYEAPFHIGGLEGSFLVGADYQKATATTYSASGRISASSYGLTGWDLDDWDTGMVSVPRYTLNPLTKTQTETKGLYSQLRLKPWSSVTLIGGARISWYDGTSTALSTGKTTEQSKTGHVTPFAGATWDITPDLTAYASYSEIFQPQLTYADANGDPLDPLTARQSEVGIKAQIGGLNLSAALFDLREQNVAQVVSTSVYSQAAGVESRGVELTASGEIADNLHVSAGYTYNQINYNRGAEDGDAYNAYTPRNILKIGLMYDVTDGFAEGWSFGGQLRAVTGYESTSTSTTIRAPGYGVVDLMAKWAINDRTDLRLGVANVLDKAYYTRVNSTTFFNFRGEPRTFTLALTRRF